MITQLLKMAIFIAFIFKEDKTMRNNEYIEKLEKENEELKRQIAMLEWELLDEKLCKAFEGVEI